MLNIRNNHELRVAYEALGIYKELIEEGKGSETAEQHVQEIKKEIRAFTNKALPEDRIVKDYGIDGFVELVKLPETIESEEEATEYFEECKVIHAQPSMYDCTGQAFTSWYRVFKRRGCFFAYHSISFDL